MSFTDTADADTQYIADNVQKYGEAEGAFQGDRKLFVEFRKEWAGQPNLERSAKEGRPVFDEVEYIRITSPGNRDNIIDCPVNDFHRHRFRERYEHWRATLENKQEVTGTPLEKWPEITRGDVEGLRYIHVYTVESLCTLDDNVLSKHPGLRELQRRAKQWMDVATKNAAASQLRLEKEKAEAQAAALQDQLAQQAARLAQLEEALLKKGK